MHVCFDSHQCLGNLRFVTEEHHAGEEVLKQVQELERQGKTAIVISDHKRVKGSSESPMKSGRKAERSSPGL